MDIALYIAELLQKHNEVCVSGLGTFYKKPVQGYFNKEKGEYYPPSWKLIFKNNYINDTRLAEYISKVKNISLPSSEYFIEKFVGQVLQELNASSTVDLAPLGVLRKRNTEYIFESNNDLLLGHEYYGLPPVKEYQKGALMPSTPKPHFVEEPNPIEETVPAVEEPRRSNTGLIIAAIVVIILLAVTGIHLWKPELIRQVLQGKTPPAGPVSPVIQEKPLKTEADSLAAADSIVNSLKNQGFEVDTARDTANISVKAQPVQPSVTYEIIAASLNRPSDAEKIVKAFKSKGIDARVVMAKDKKRNNILISLASLPDKAAAQKELMRIKKEIEPGAYIYDLKNQ